MDSDQETVLIAEVTSWAAQKHISLDTIKPVIEMGFSSLDAIACLSADDLKKCNSISVGQKKLLLKAAGGLEGAQTPSTPSAAEGNGNAARSDTPSQPEASLPGGNVPSDGFAAILRQHLEAGVSRPGVPIQGGVDPQGGAAPITGNLSWQDPQVFIKSVSGTTRSTCYNIVDFVDNHIYNAQSERVLSTGDEFEIVCRAGSRKPRLEQLTISQWSLANLAILYRLVEEGSLSSSEILDYLSHTSQIYSLIASHELVSVYQYDREYRRLQSIHKFRWGTNIGHLAPGFLRVRSVVNGPINSAKPKLVSRPERPPTRPSSFQSHTSEGKTICRNYNGRVGCSFRGCKFEHICNVPGCGKSHPGINHSDSKN
jgi:hypothetical protein